MNNGFIDGNKRVAFATTIISLQANGLEPTGSQDDWIEFIYINLGAKTFNKATIDAWLRSHVATIDLAEDPESAK